MSRCSPGCIIPTPTLCQWWRRPPSSGAPVTSTCFAPSSARRQDVDDIVTELVRARVLERRGTDGWRFRHELLREVAAELAPPSLRRDLHARAARALVDAASASNRTGVWSQPISSTPSSTTTPSRPTRRRPSTPGGAALCKRRWLAS